MRIRNVGETVVVVGAIEPYPRLQIVDDEGNVIDGSGWTLVEMEVITAMGASTLIPGTLDGDTWAFAWGAETATAGRLRTLVRVTGTPSSPPLYGPTYLIYNPADLWVSPTDVLALAGGDYTEAQAVTAILQAQMIVGAWVSVPVQSPVPEPIYEATLLLATRALTASESPTPTATGVIQSETIADYTVRYAIPDSDEGWVALLGPEALALLAPYRGNVYQVGIAPANPHHPLPIADLYGSGWWWGDAVIYDEEYLP